MLVVKEIADTKRRHARKELGEVRDGAFGSGELAVNEEGERLTLDATVALLASGQVKALFGKDRGVAGFAPAVADEVELDVTHYACPSRA